MHRPFSFTSKQMLNVLKMAPWSYCHPMNLRPLWKPITASQTPSTDTHLTSPFSSPFPPRSLPLTLPSSVGLRVDVDNQDSSLFYIRIKSLVRMINGSGSCEAWGPPPSTATRQSTWTRSFSTPDPFRPTGPPGSDGSVCVSCLLDGFHLSTKDTQEDPSLSASCLSELEESVLLTWRCQIHLFLLYFIRRISLTVYIILNFTIDIVAYLCHFVIDILVCKIAKLIWIWIIIRSSSFSITSRSSAVVVARHGSMRSGLVVVVVVYFKVLYVLEVRF